MVGDVSTTTTIDGWKAAGAVPTNANSITNGHEPALSAATYATDDDITDWSTNTVTKGDVFRFNVDANDNATFLTLQLRVIL